MADLERSGIEAVVEGLDKFLGGLQKMGHQLDLLTAVTVGSADQITSSMTNAMNGLDLSVRQGTKGVMDAVRGIGQVGESGAQSSTGLNALAVAAGALGAALVQQVVQVVKDAIQQIIELGRVAVETAGRWDELNTVATLLGTRMGATRQQVQGYIQDVRAAGIRTDVASSLVANFARRNLDMARAVDLARVAQDAAIFSMEDSSDALDALMYGITTHNTRVLRTRGILVNLNAAYDEYARLNNIVGRELTETERVQATFNAVLAEGVNIAGAYEAAMELPAKQLRTLRGREIPELLAALGAPLQAAFGTLISSLRQLVAWLTEAFSVGGRFYPVLQAIGLAAKYAADAFSGLVQAITGPMGTTLADKMAEIGAQGGEGFSKGFEGGLDSTKMALAQWENSFFGKLADAALDAFEWGANIVAGLAEGIIQAAANILIAAMNFVSGVLSGWLGPGSPPRVAPHIDDWGTAAMTEFLHGFTKADFSALDALQGPLKKALPADLFREVNVGLARVLAGRGGMQEVLDKIAKGAGELSQELMELAQVEFELADATESIAEAERLLEQQRRIFDRAQGDVQSLTEEYNRLLRAGADDSILEAKLAEINAAEERRDVAAQEVAAADQSLDAQKERLEMLKEQSDLQRSIVRELQEIVDLQQQAGRGGGAGGRGGAGAGAGVGAPALDIGVPSFEGIGARMDVTLTLIQKRLAERFREIWADVAASWQEAVGPVMEEVNESAERMFGLVDEAVGRLIPGADTASEALWSVVKVIGPRINPLLEQMGRIVRGTVNKGLEELRRLWEDRIRPALQNVWDFISGTFAPGLGNFIRDTIGPLNIGLENIGTALDNFTSGLEKIADLIEQGNWEEVFDIFLGRSPAPLAKGFDSVTESVNGLVSSLRTLDRAYPATALVGGATAPAATAARAAGGSVRESIAVPVLVNVYGSGDKRFAEDIGAAVKEKVLEALTLVV